MTATKRKWTAEQREQLANGDIEGDFAGPDQSYPIAGPADVGDAWRLAGQAENPDQVRREIIRIAKKHGWESGLPDTAIEWADERGINVSKNADETQEATGASALRAVKMLGQNRLGGYAVLWGDDRERDLDGEWFDPQTEELTDIFKAMGKLPYLYNHATDTHLKSSVVGAVDILEPDDVGLWYEAQLEKANQYKEAILHLVSEKALGTSSGTLPGARRVEKSGRIARWPIVELSGTPTPADPRQMERPIAEVKSAFKSIGLDFAEDGEAATPKAGGDPAATVPDEANEAKAEELTLRLRLLELA